MLRSLLPRSTSKRRPRWLLAMLMLAAAAPASAAVGEKDHPDWPCVQRKVVTLTSSQIWDGPPIEDLKDWSADNEIVKLVPGLVSRRVPIGDAAAAIKAYADKVPAAERDQKLMRLFAGVLTRINEERTTVINGVERFQKRQRTRSEQIERESSEIIKLKEKAGKDAAAEKALAEAEEKHNWDVRVFQERQQNIPLACEIPVQIEARAFDLGREIRTHMSK